MTEAETEEPESEIEGESEPDISNLRDSDLSTETVSVSLAATLKVEVREVEVEVRDESWSTDDPVRSARGELIEHLRESDTLEGIDPDRVSVKGDQLFLDEPH